MDQKHDKTSGALLATSDDQPPSSLAIARNGIHTGRDFACLMSALMTDLIEGRVTPGVGNAACNAGGKLLKVVEMQAKYGQTNGAREKTLYLTGVPEENAPGNE